MAFDPVGELPSISEFGIGPRNSAADNDARIATRLVPYLAQGGEVRIPARERGETGPFAVQISQPIELSAACSIYGAGSNCLHELDPGTPDYRSGFIWVGAADAPYMLKVAPPSGPTQRRIAGFHMSDVAFFGQDLVKRCVELRSHGFPVIERVSVQGAKDEAVYCGVVDTLGEARDFLHGAVDFRIFQVGALSGRGWVNEGDLSANVCKNTFNITAGFYKNAPILVERNADTNFWPDCTVHNWGVAGQLAIDLQGGPDAKRSCRSEEFNWLSPGNGVVRIGGVNHGYAVASGAFDKKHQICFDYENSSHALFDIGVGAGVAITNYASHFDAFKADAPVYNAAWPNPGTIISMWGSGYLNPHGCFDATSGVYTAKVPGEYQFHGCLTHDNTIEVGSRWDIQFVSSNGQSRAMSYTPTAANWNTVTLPDWTVSLNASDQIWLTIRRVGGGGQFKLHPAAGMNRFWGGLSTR